MEVYLSLKQIPELKGLSKREQKRRWRIASWRALKHWQTWLALLLGASTGAGCVGIAIHIIEGVKTNTATGAITGWLCLMLAFAAGGICSLPYGVIVVRIARPHLKQMADETGNISKVAPIR